MKALQHARAKAQKPRQSVLRIMAMMLIAAVFLRVGDQIGAASAAPTSSENPPLVERADRVLGMPLDDQTLPQLLETFKAREAKLLEAEEAARQRSAALEISAQSVAEQLVKLEAAEAKLAETLAMTDTAAAADLDRLATVYENMKPRDTAALFSQMAPGFAAGFLGLMRPEAAAAIMTELEPEAAHLISVMLAGRNASAPTRQ